MKGYSIKQIIDEIEKTGMKITIAVDAQPIFSALLGGVARKVFFDPRFKFITTDFTVSEVKKYLAFIAEKSGKQEKDIIRALDLLPLTAYEQQYYEQNDQLPNNSSVHAIPKMLISLHLY